MKSPAVSRAARLAGHGRRSPVSRVPAQAEGAEAWGALEAEVSGAPEATARERFLKILAEKDGDWRDEAVAEELKLLEEANPTADAAFSGTYLDAKWLQVSKADFNYRGEPGENIYTLGEISFGMYEPTDMRLQVIETTQVVAPVADGNGTRTWDISLSVACVDERFPPFEASMSTFGQIKPTKDADGRDRRLEVKFTGGELKPLPGTDDVTMKHWVNIFSTALTERKQNVGSIFKDGMMSLMMGLRLPSQVDVDGTVTFEMRKPPCGYADILYIDDKLRVTRGNRGSIVVATRGGV